MANPRLYATFLLWLLSELFEKLPEVGDPPKPKLVFFFDEAHLLFNEAPKALLDKVEQVVRLIRSKGVGVYFVTQNPLDVPEKVLAQLGNRMQHALRAFTPRDQKAVAAAAETFRPNPKLNTVQVITAARQGRSVGVVSRGRRHARDGRPHHGPSAVGADRPGDAGRAQGGDGGSPVKGKYDQTIDPQSAYEILQKRLAAGGALPPPGTARHTRRTRPDRHQAPAPGGILHRIGEGFRGAFRHGRPRGTALTTIAASRPAMWRARSPPGSPGQVAADLARSTGSKTAGTH